MPTRPTSAPGEGGGAGSAGSARPDAPDAASRENEAVALEVLERRLPALAFDQVKDASLVTPQNAALEWVLYEDAFAHDWAGLAAGAEVAEMDFLQRYVAYTLYAVLTGEGWRESDLWTTAADVCDWYGATCVGEAEDAAREDAEGLGVERGLQQGGGGGSGHPRAIHTLQLANNNLYGWLPPDLAVLTSLEHLELHRNGIFGEIPPSIYDMTGLRTLFLDANRLEGPMSTAIGNLVNLEKFTLSENRMGGTIPTEIGRLTNLEMIWLYNNKNLEGPFPAEMGNLVNLSACSFVTSRLSQSPCVMSHLALPA